MVSRYTTIASKISVRRSTAERSPTHCPQVRCKAMFLALLYYFPKEVGDKVH